ncbi:hypothetical protein ACTMTJ_09715 [Phytohabitans sp. LJ34]|uniref:hypothetical protein n=1 Tax=Phytohabitans sp. LJ34 TaxID=3452217 RepID=UPI003F8BFD94
MDFVLTTASAVVCDHPTPGHVDTAGAARLVVAGAEVLTRDGVAGMPVSGCVASGANTTKCGTVQTVSSLGAAKLSVGGQAVLLGLTGTTDGLLAGVPAKLSTTPAQIKLSAV